MKKIATIKTERHVFASRKEAEAALAASRFSGTINATVNGKKMKIAAEKGIIVYTVC